MDKAELFDRHDPVELGNEIKSPQPPLLKGECTDNNLNSASSSLDQTLGFSPFAKGAGGISY